jgi:hypothetical protein
VGIAVRQIPARIHARLAQLEDHRAPEGGRTVGEGGHTTRRGSRPGAGRAEGDQIRTKEHREERGQERPEAARAQGEARVRRWGRWTIDSEGRAEVDGTHMARSEHPWPAARGSARGPLCSCCCQSGSRRRSPRAQARRRVGDNA